MTETAERFDCWAIVEAMGFKKYAGHVTTQELAGASFIRVDVPETSIPGYSKLIGSGSIYMITPTDEATARKAAAVLARGDSPLPVYIPQERQLSSGPIPSQRELEEEGDWDSDFVDHDEDQDAIDGQIMAEGDAAQTAEEGAKA